MAVDLFVTYKLVDEAGETIIASLEVRGSAPDAEVVDAPSSEPRGNARLLPAGSSVLAPGLSTPVPV